MLSCSLLSASLREIHRCSCKLQVARHLLHVASCKLHADRRQCEDADDRVPLAVVLLRDRTDHEVRLEVRRLSPIASLASHVARKHVASGRATWRMGRQRPTSPPNAASRSCNRRSPRRSGAPAGDAGCACGYLQAGLRCTDRFVAAHRVNTPRAAPVPGLNHCQGAPVGMRMDMEKPRPHLR